MRVPLSWLKEFVDINLSVLELAEVMTMAGMEVEHIDYYGTPEAELPWERDKFFLAHILEVVQHPNADRLVLATLNIGTDAPETVVTGAPNLFPYVGKGDIRALGLMSPFVMEGGTVFDGQAKESGKKMKLKRKKIRGIMNRHMLCSELELGLSAEHEGIMLLQSEASPGTPLVDVLGDVVIEFDLLPNIARTASIVGVAREVAALTGQTMRYPNYEIMPTGPSLAGRLKIETTRPDLNPRFTAILVEGVRIGPSPEWMQRRLKLAGMRPINNIVDISNYVMLEMGQPNHAFDWDVLQQRAESYGGPVTIITRMPEAGETLETLDGEIRQVPESAILVTDPKSALSVGGIMGGAESEISDSSTNLLIEAAAWNFINIRQTATAMKLHSEAGYRFSRGVHPSQALLGAKRVARLVQNIAGGTIAQDLYDYEPVPAPTITLEISSADVEHLLGIALDLATIKGYLEAVEFVCAEIAGGRLQVTVPDYRLDISDDPVIGRADLIEEIARLVGYDKIPVTELSDTLPPQRNNIALDREELIRDLLVQAGLQEIITHRLTTIESEVRLLSDGSAFPDDKPYVSLINPASSERIAMRHSLLNSVLDVVAANTRFTDQVSMFEIGPVFLDNEAGPLPEEAPRLVIMMIGPRDEVTWLGGESTVVDFYDLKGVVENLMQGLHIADVHYQAAQRPSFYPGRTAELRIGQQFLGVLGELHPQVVAAYEMPKDVPVLAADMNLDVLLDHVTENYPIKSIGRFPAVQQDIAVIVYENVTAAQVEDVIWQTGGFLLVDVRLFDVYRGEQVGNNKKSLAYRLSFQSPDRTLTDKVVAKQQTRIVKQLEKVLKAELRG